MLLITKGIVQEELTIPAVIQEELTITSICIQDVLVAQVIGSGVAQHPRIEDLSVLQVIINYHGSPDVHRIPAPVIDHKSVQHIIPVLIIHRLIQQNVGGGDPVLAFMPGLVVRVQDNSQPVIQETLAHIPPDLGTAQDLFLLVIAGLGHNTVI